VSDVELRQPRLERIAPGPQRDALLPLLRLADDSERQIRSYYQLGDLFVLRGDGGEARGVTLAVPEPDGSVQLKAVAVASALQNRGAGKRMIALVLQELRAAGVRRVAVGTAACAIDAIAFYQKTGFRPWRVERDFFTRERGYDPTLAEHGIPLRDMLWLDRDLS
jgi:GNAT superfamily N-acetyltransferase